MRTTLMFLMRVLLAQITRRDVAEVRPLALSLGGREYRLYATGHLLPALAGADDPDPDDEVDEDSLPDNVKEILRKERKARKDAEKATREAQRAVEAAQSAQSDLAARISELEEQGDGGDDETAKELEKLNKRLADAERKATEATERERQAQERARRAKLEAALRNPALGIAPDMVDIAAERIEVEFDDDGNPQDVEDAAKELLEARPSLAVREDEPAPAAGPANPGAKRQRGSTMTREDVQRMSRDEPEKFAELYEKGEIPASALGG